MPLLHEALPFLAHTYLKQEIKLDSKFKEIRGSIICRSSPPRNSFAPIKAPTFSFAVISKSSFVLESLWVFMDGND